MHVAASKTAWRGRTFLPSALAALAAAPLWAAQGIQRTPDLSARRVLVSDPGLTESSGLAVSRRSRKVLWTHNDSGSAPDLFALDAGGRVLARVRVAGADAVDWEDMAAGTGPGGGPALYIGDIGDNERRRSECAVYRIPEPEVDPAWRGVRRESAPAERFPFRYPDGRHDAETLLVHPTSGEILIVTKDDSGRSGIYRFPAPPAPDRACTLERVGEVRFRGVETGIRRLDSLQRMATGGSVSADGRRLVIRTYAFAREWRVPAGGALAQALASPSFARHLLPPGQGEAIAYRPDGKALYCTCEGSPCPLWEVPLPGKR